MSEIEEHMPTTEEVREYYVLGVPVDTWLAARDEYGLAFDRWLAQHDAEVARRAEVKALRDFRIGFGRRYAFQDPYGHFDSDTVSALHRQVEGILDAEIARLEEAGHGES